MPPSWACARIGASRMPRPSRFSGAHFAAFAACPCGTAGGGGFGMIYQAYEALELLAMPLRQIAEEAAYQFSRPWSGLWPGDLWPGDWPPSWFAAASVLAEARLTHTRPEFGIAGVTIG